jgi:hypothetical protein
MQFEKAVQALWMQASTLHGGAQLTYDLGLRERSEIVFKKL